jgi:hypothetical protein
MITAILSLISCYSYGQPKIIRTEPVMRRVIVYHQGAQVERQSTLKLDAGKSEILVSGLSPEIDRQSIQIKLHPDIQLLSINHQLNHLRQQHLREEIRELQENDSLLKDKVALEQAMLQVYKQEEQMLQKNQEIRGDQGIRNADLREAMEYMRSKMTEVLRKQLETGHTITRLENQRKKMAQQLAALNQSSTTSTSDLVVTVKSPRSIESPFTLHYLVEKARWTPVYDIRVKNVSSPIEIVQKAQIEQQSGETWRDVNMILSTGNPKEGAIKPDLQTWYLSYQQPKLVIRGMSSVSSSPSGRVVGIDGQPLVGATVMVKGSTTSTITNADGLFWVAATPGSSKILDVSMAGMDKQEIVANNSFVQVMLRPSTNNLQEVVVTGYSIAREESSWNYTPTKARKLEVPAEVTVQTITLEYEIKESFSVPNDGKTYTTDIQHVEVPASFEYYAAPKLSNAVYLTAHITEWEDLNLISGETSLFFEGAFLGKSQLNADITGDTLSISLGIDRSVLVQRKKMADFTSRKFLGNNLVDSRGFDIVIRNTRADSILLILEDQVPVSTEKEIEVFAEEISGGKRDEKTGIVRWTVSLAPRQETRKSIGYKVKHPREKSLVLE